VTEAGASQRKQRLQGTGMETCFFCRGTAREATRNSVPTTDSSRSVQAEQMTMARKRLRSTAASGGAPEKGETVEKKSVVSCKNEKDESFSEAQLQMTVTAGVCWLSLSPFLSSCLFSISLLLAVIFLVFPSRSSSVISVSVKLALMSE
jgi:hypothetical protein